MIRRRLLAWPSTPPSSRRLQTNHERLENNFGDERFSRPPTRARRDASRYGSVPIGTSDQVAPSQWSMSPEKP